MRLPNNMKESPIKRLSSEGHYVSGNRIKLDSHHYAIRFSFDARRIKTNGGGF